MKNKVVQTRAMPPNSVSDRVLPCHKSLVRGREGIDGPCMVQAFWGNRPVPLCRIVLMAGCPARIVVFAVARDRRVCCAPPESLAVLPGNNTLDDEIPFVQIAAKIPR